MQRIVAQHEETRAASGHQRRTLGQLAEAFQVFLEGGQDLDGRLSQVVEQRLGGQRAVAFGQGPDRLRTKRDRSQLVQRAVDLAGRARVVEKNHDRVKLGEGCVRIDAITQTLDGRAAAGHEKRDVGSEARRDFTQSRYGKPQLEQLVDGPQHRRRV